MKTLVSAILMAAVCSSITAQNISDDDDTIMMSPSPSIQPSVIDPFSITGVIILVIVASFLITMIIFGLIFYILIMISKWVRERRRNDGPPPKSLREVSKSRPAPVSEDEIEYQTFTEEISALPDDSAGVTKVFTHAEPKVNTTTTFGATEEVIDFTSVPPLNNSDSDSD